MTRDSEFDVVSKDPAGNASARLSGRRSAESRRPTAPNVRAFSLLLLLGVTIATGCKRGNDAIMPQRPPPPVTVIAAVAKDVPIYLDEIGKTTAREYVNVQPQVTGQIEKIHFEDGAEVKKNDLLFTIDARPFEAAVAQAEANAAQQKAQLDLAGEEYKRVEGLIETKAVSKQDFDQKKNAVAVAEAQMKAGDAAVKTSKLNLDYCMIRSPIDGRASLRMVDVGNIVKADEASLLSIQRLDPIYADFTTNERNLGAVRKHMSDGTLKVQVTIPGEKGAAPGEGDLTFLDSSVAPGTGTIKLRATLKNEDRRFWAGQFVNVRLVLEIKKDVVVVPATSIQISQAGPFVYVVDKDSNARVRQVEQGQRQGEGIVLNKGVSPGETVVVTGQMNVVPDQKVTVVAPPPETQPAATGVAKS